ncbi:MAG: VCBS repeat-containing protein, partial [Acidobacteria bacterium]|nr:VCBS repeat-containing protein [Acidobacteriota bacterium]
ADAALDERSSILPEVPPSQRFAPRPVGDPPGPNERPQIAHVEIVDLDADGLPDILVCDAGRSRISWIRQAPAGTYEERLISDDILAPAHVEAVDLDGDGDRDLLVASLGQLFPSNLRIGAVVVLENLGGERFESHVVADGIPRVADARAGDLDGDGDPDLTVAAFGYDYGETLWLENRGGWVFEPHVLQRLSGAINAVIVDIDGDDAPDVVSLVSQEWEEVWAFDTGDQFEAELIWGSANADFGSSWISVVDLDGDGLSDLLHSNGDAFDYAPANSRPWHGVQWLQNLGDRRFRPRRIADLSGASSPQADDVDGDGDLDVVVASAYNQWSDPEVRSLVWLENDGEMRFAMRRIAVAPTHLVTLAMGDLDGNGTPDLVTGGMHISPPYDRMSRVTIWSNRENGPRP